ncbi:hypothetical protein [Actinotalea sp. K2]|uniref:hypothetical protein n=1 Tax=Actinotalea sp. K2 TaxID=2939438 RepID=UPI002016C377|nr:hypothetical protein [Actinotalea sp. K2]MCL3860684.1 hypothetical protein [Actinotalea sp. K2]
MTSTINQTTMTRTTMRHGRLLLLAAVILLVVLAGSTAAAMAITDRPVEQLPDGPQYTTESVAVAPISRTTATAPCPAGSTAIDGGLSSESTGFTRVVASAAAVDGSGWSVELWNQHPSSGLTAHVWAECLTTS